MSPSADDESEARDKGRLIQRWVARIVDVRAGEGHSLAWSCAYFFCLLYAYSILRPVRESLGLSGGAANLPWLFSGTMVVMLAVNPAFALLVTKLPRTRFIPIVYRVSMAVMITFWILLHAVAPEYRKAVGNAFYVWVSVFNLFAVSVFWSFMADVWKLPQAKRLFGFIGIGGTLGALLGAKTTAQVALAVGTEECLLVTVVFLELAVFSMRRLARRHGVTAKSDELSPSTEHVEKRSIWTGIQLVAREPYLRSIAAYTVLYALIGSFLYFQQGFLVEKSISSRDERTALFGEIDFWANLVTITLQIFLTGRLIRWFGITFALLSQPLVALIGWSVLAMAILYAPELAQRGLSGFGLPAELAVLIVVQILLRASNYATAKPAREALYTVVGREVKYKSKSFIDTMIYRAGDFTGAWMFKGLQYAGIGLTGIAFVPVPLALVWVGVGYVLGRQQRALALRVEARDSD